MNGPQSLIPFCFAISIAFLTIGCGKPGSTPSPPAPPETRQILPGKDPGPLTSEPEQLSPEATPRSPAPAESVSKSQPPSPALQPDATAPTPPPSPDQAAQFESTKNVILDARREREAALEKDRKALLDAEKQDTP